jgi:hypothetical protein
MRVRRGGREELNERLTTKSYKKIAGGVKKSIFLFGKNFRGEE